MNINEMTHRKTVYPAAGSAYTDSESEASTSRGSGDDDLMYVQNGIGRCHRPYRVAATAGTGASPAQQWKTRPSQKRDIVDENGNVIPPTGRDRGSISKSSQQAFNHIFSQPFKHTRTVDSTDVETDTIADTFTPTNSVFFSDTNQTIGTVPQQTPLAAGTNKTAPKKRMGRPVGSRNKIKKTTTGERDGSVQNTGGNLEGKHFSSAEGLYLAKAWINQSMKGTNQSEESMWAGIAEYCDEQYQFKRQPSAMRAKWSTLRKGVHIYLGAEEHVRAGNNSGRTEEELIEMTMTLYKVKGGRILPNGERKDCVEFKYVDAARYLADYPKFGGITEEEEGRAIKDAMKPGGTSPSKDEDVPYKRPKGVKTQRREQFKIKVNERKELDRNQKQKNLENSTKAMNRLATCQERERRGERNFRLMKLLSKDSEQYKRLLNLMMCEVDNEKELKNDSDTGEG